MSFMVTKVRKILEKDGTLTLEELPYQKGDQVEVTILPTSSPSKIENSYSLRGTVIRFETPTDPVADSEWEAAE